MSSNNAESGAAGMAVAGIGLAFLFVGVVMAAFVIIVVVVATVLAILAWRHEVTIGSITVTPDEAHGLITCGVAGMVLIPTIMFVGDLCGAKVNWGWWYGYIVCGYFAGAAGFLWSLDDKSPVPAPIHKPVVQPHVVRQPIPPALPPSSPAPFQFASWDDEGRQP